MDDYTSNFQNARVIANDDEKDWKDIKEPETEHQLKKKKRQIY